MATKKTPAKAKAKTAAKFDIMKVAVKHLEDMMAIPAATNRCADLADYVCKHAKKQGYAFERQWDDTVHIKITGTDKKSKRVIGYGAHLDRIGLMVDDLCDDGSIKFSGIGGLYPGHLMDGVIASVQTEKGMLTGVITHEVAPIHKAKSLKEWEDRAQKYDKLRLRPDANIGCTKKDGKKTLEKQGVKVGQLVWLDPMLNVDAKHGTLRSRWLDNTLGCVALLTLLDWWVATKTTPKQSVDLIFSVAEEAGMGGTSVIFPELTDFISVDTGVAEDTEEMESVLILQKAGRMPYSIGLIQELEAAADKAKAKFVRKNLDGGGTDAEQARGAGFKGRIASLDMPIYGLHSIEATTFNIVENMVKTLNSHANM